MVKDLVVPTNRSLRTKQSDRHASLCAKEITNSRALSTCGGASISGDKYSISRDLSRQCRANPGRLLGELSNLLFAQSLIEELKGVVRYARGKLVDTVGTSSAALAGGKKPANRGQGTPLVEAGVTSRQNPQHTTVYESGP